jgi:deferrochelatase/peroxidase EfeB
MMTHAFINVVIPFASEYSGEVNKVLRDLTEPVTKPVAKPETEAVTKRERGNEPNEEIEEILRNIGTVHFMSITVVEPTCPAERDRSSEDQASNLRSKDSHLLIEISADGGTEETLTVLADGLEPELKRILHAANLELGDASLSRYLLRRNRVIGAAWGCDALGQVFSGSPGMTVQRILDEEYIAARIGALIDHYRNPEPGTPELDDLEPGGRKPGGQKRRGWYESSPRQRLDRVRDRLWWEGEKWAFVPEPAPCLAGDPHNKWKADPSISNPQARKAGLSIFNTLLWPLYLLFALIVLAEFALAWLYQGPIIALMWTAFVFTILLIAVALAAWSVYSRLRHLENTDEVDDRTPLAEQVEELMRVENFCAQNHLASVSRLKRGWLRRLTLRLAFIVVGTGRFICAPGFLGKNGVIHFARWMRLPGTDQLLFWSNFDGTWESYVADFIADAPSGVTAIWSNCLGFPRTHSLFRDGATNRDRLVRWARRQQQPTLFWYSAYRDLTAERIRINAAIRQGLASAESDADARDWFDLFGSAPRPPEALQTAQLPTLVLGGLSGLRYAQCHVIKFSDDIQSCKKWLASAAADATYGETLPGQRCAIVVALSASGFERLGVPPDAIKTFPVAFQQGMWPEWRARALGDTGPNEPERWEWGFPNKEQDEGKRADALLLGYGLTDHDVSSALGKLLEGVRELGHTVVHELPLTPLPEKADGTSAGAKRREFPREPFGFADGVSQPVIRGTPRSKTRTAPNDLVAAGEIVLGYPDNLDVIPPSPSIADENDPAHLLPDAGTDPTRKRPEFSRYEGNGRRDLGANGTFMVVRQLQQNVGAFREWLEKAAEQIRADAIVAADPKPTALEPTGPECTAPQPTAAQRIAILWGNAAQEAVPGSPLARPRADNLSSSGWAHSSEDRKRVKNAIAAKLVGRWQDGTSLVRHPLMPGTYQDLRTPADNDFLLGAEDPSGLSCPFGSHIRRANPRDTRFQGKDPAEIASTNRHRILRVGRRYGTPDTEDPPQGLLFMCLNADIERQFEFIQKTWILNPNIHGLENEVDPIMGHGSRKLTVPTPTGPVVLRDLPDFVTMKGGGYFFLPGRAVLRYLATGGDV